MWLKIISIIFLCSVSCDEIDLKCEYGDYSSIDTGIQKYVKVCYAKKGFAVVNRESRISSVNEVSGFEKSSITDFSANKKIVKFIPQNLGGIFENLLTLSITDCQLSEISKDDMKQFPKIQLLELFDNPIEILESNVFQYNPNLAAISFYNNKLKFIDPQAFNGLSNLKTLDLFDNVCISSGVEEKDKVQGFISEAANKCKDSNISNFLKIGK